MPLIFLSLALAQAPVVPYAGIGEKPVAPDDLPGDTEDAPVAPPPPPVVRKLDCLAGVCLGSSPTSTAPTLVTVSDEKWGRTVEVCAGKVVNVWISHAWYQTGFTFVNSVAGSMTPVYEEDGTAAANVLRRVSSAMQANGWVLWDVKDTLTSYMNPAINGGRGVVFKRSGEDVHGWTVGIVTVHPDREAICAARDGQGL